MLTFLQAIYISFVILHLSNIWVALIPRPSLIIIAVGTYILLISIFLGGSIKKQSYLIFMALVFSLFVGLMTQFIMGRTALQVVTISMIIGVSTTIVFLWNKRQELYAVKIYIIICSIISLLGVVAWLIVNYTFIFQQYIDPSHVIELNEFTGGRMGRGDGINIFGLSLEAYSFPYSLGLVLTGSYAYEFFGIPLFRSSGIFNEPNSTAFMSIPALILTLNSSYFGKYKRRILLVIQYCFIGSAMSLSVIISLISVFIIYKLFVLFIADISRFSPIKLLYLFLIVGIIGFLGVYCFNMVPNSGVARNILQTKFGASDYVSIALDTIFNTSVFFGFFCFLSISLYCAFIAVRKNNNRLMSFSLVIICLLISSLKGSFFHIVINPGFYIFFFLMLKNYNSNDFQMIRINGKKKLDWNEQSGVEN